MWIIPLRRGNTGAPTVPLVSHNVAWEAERWRSQAVGFHRSLGHIWGQGPRCLQDAEGFLCPPGWSASFSYSTGSPTMVCFFSQAPKQLDQWLEIVERCLKHSKKTSPWNPCPWHHFSIYWHQFIGISSRKIIHVLWEASRGMKDLLRASFTAWWLMA